MAGPDDGAGAGSGVATGARGGPLAKPSGGNRRSRSRRGVFGRHPVRLAIAVVAVLGLVTLFGGYWWVSSEASASGPPGPQVIVSVPLGSGVGTLAATLEQRGVIRSAVAFRIWMLLHGDLGVTTGEYAFRKNDGFAAVESLLSAGPNVFTLNIPVGYTVSEVARQVDQLPGRTRGAFQTLATSGTLRSPWQPTGSQNLDGLLGTGVYQVVPGETNTQLLTLMIDRFDAEANAVGLAAKAASLGLTPYQMVTVASIVEKEGVIQPNLGPVARVIFNRLASNMPLQMDSTVLYAENRDGGTVTHADESLQSPYNSYLNRGLPPSPICFPSLASLQAALAPPVGGWLYFTLVSQNGTEAFANTFAQQLANEALAQRRGLP